MWSCLPKTTKTQKGEKEMSEEGPDVDSEPSLGLTA
jgi:hypothetical protein